MVIGVIMIPVLYFAGAGSTVFWIIGNNMEWESQILLYVVCQIGSFVCLLACMRCC